MQYGARLQLVAALFGSGLASSPLAGQATVVGIVIEAGTGRPIADVLVALDAARQITAADGRFRFTDVLAGSRTLRVSHVAYARRTDTLAVRVGEHIDLRIPIAVEAIAIAPLAVEARSRRLIDVGFYERANRGIGIHVTRDQLESTRATRLGDFLARLPGVRRAMLSGDLSRIDIRGSGQTISARCDTQVFLDGSAVAAGTAILDHLSPGNVEGLEIYRGASETPIQFEFGQSSCGAIVIWTRRS